MENRSHAFIAGLFVILLSVLGIAGAVWLGPDKGPMRLPIDLLSTHSVTGLKVDAPVRFRGVDVGRVDSISFDSHQAGEIRVRIEVDPAAPISRPHTPN
jgi:phospholipid/cholesterol/gamma-HCH transport system substrate-binding protein